MALDVLYEAKVVVVRCSAVFFLSILIHLYLFRLVLINCSVVILFSFIYTQLGWCSFIALLSFNSSILIYLKSISLVLVSLFCSSSAFIHLYSLILFQYFIYFTA